MVLGAMALLGLGILAAPVHGRDTIMGPVEAEVVRVIDGDTVVVRARIWLGQHIETRVRLEGVDAPELTGSCKRERRMAQQARSFMQSLIGGRGVLLRGIAFGKYGGRVIARVETADGEDCSRALIRAGLARAYDGGRKVSWCPRSPDSRSDPKRQPRP